jgi:hypothetical protein
MKKVRSLRRLSAIEEGKVNQGWLDMYVYIIYIYDNIYMYIYYIYIYIYIYILPVERREHVIEQHAAAVLVHSARECNALLLLRFSQVSVFVLLY